MRRCVTWQNPTQYISLYRTDEEKDLLVTAYKAILNLIPKLKKHIPIHEDADFDYFYSIVNAVCGAYTHRDALTYVTQMQGGCNMARSEAIRRIKQNMIVYLAAGRNPLRFDSQSKDKSSRGLNHPITGRLLIPAEYVLDWDADPDG